MYASTFSGQAQSPAYAKQSGKPVVTLWGFGFAGRPYTPVQAIETIRFFKNRGLYVVGGVPFWWRGNSPVDWDQDPDPAWAQVYAEFDMVIPWSPGRIVDDGTIQARYSTIVEPDAAFQKMRGKDYGVTVFPGLAWSNWNAGARNGTPRRGGQFLWNQIGRVAQMSNTFLFIAMFDEYNEATAIAPTAENASMIPRDQYFLTLDADGFDLSSDFYLRLTSAIREIRAGTRTWTSQVPTPRR